MTAKSFTPPFLQSFFNSKLTLTIASDEISLNKNEFFLRVNNLTNLLKQKNFAPQSRVAVLAGKSIDQVVAMFACWRLGLVYVPVSQHNPPMRVSYILDDSDAQLVVVGKRASVEKYGLEARNLIVLEDQVLTTSSPLISELNVSLEDVAYIIYTSGSTGNPKGVTIKFHSLENLSLALDEFFQELNQDTETFLQVVDFAFDVSVSDLLLWMKKGGTFITTDIGQNILKFVKLVIEKKVTYVCNSAPVYSLMGSLKENLKDLDFTGVKSVITTASYCPPKTALDIIELFPKARLYNCYGPTETTVYCCWKEITKEEIRLDEPLSIGHALLNLTSFAFDGTNLVPTDEFQEQQEFELCIGGPQVFAGYWKKESLTLEKTIRDPQHGFIYRTGDLVYRKGSEFYYRGRTDDTIKVQGFRVNLSEIEITVGQVSFLSNQVVIPVEDEKHQVELVLYFTVKDNAGVDEKLMVQQIKEHLKTKLPKYMIPGKYILRSELPLNNSGKVDKKKLTNLIA